MIMLNGLSRGIFDFQVSFRQSTHMGEKHYARRKYFPVAANFSLGLFQSNLGSDLDSEPIFIKVFVNMADIVCRE